MNVYTYTEARQKLARLLDQAADEGEVRIKRKDGRIFVVKMQRREKSPLEVEGMDLGISTREILEYIEEGRR
jgi:PHD/YefM family antitoxin component YafN of YafNO toxin-antitoxin module